MVDFLIIMLPEDIARLPLAAQPVVVNAATLRRRSYPSLGPFGPSVAFEFRRTESYSIYLNKEANFAQDDEETN